MDLPFIRKILPEFGWVNGVESLHKGIDIQFAGTHRNWLLGFRRVSSQFQDVWKKSIPLIQETLITILVSASEIEISLEFRLEDDFRRNSFTYFKKTLDRIEEPLQTEVGREVIFPIKLLGEACIEGIPVQDIEGIVLFHLIELQF